MTSYVAARAEAFRLFRIGVAAADPFALVVRSLVERPVPVPGRGGRLSVVAVGKAAPAMASAARSIVEADETLIVTVDGLGTDTSGADLLVASHPVPDKRGEKAAREVLRRASLLGANDRLLALISGGASALLPAPVDGISLAEKIAVNTLLLSSGADIAQTNLVRQALSRIKGGGLARAAMPAAVASLILSDVVGDDLRVVGSGPTAEPLGTALDAVDVLRRWQLWDAIPGSVRDHLLRTTQLPKPYDVDNRLIGSNGLSLAAMGRANETARIVSSPLVGDVSDAAATVLEHLPESGRVVLFGGETTVRVRGGGLGGRNQELGLRVAALADDRDLPKDWVFLSCGTDGRDGPTDAAGSLVDAGTIGRMRAAGLDPNVMLGCNDSYPALQASGDLSRVSPTGTNVADLQVLVRL